MAKSKEQSLARSLRKNGLSIKEISDKLKVSKSSASLWCSEIKLTEEQIQKLHDKMVRGSYKGRMIVARLQKERKKEEKNRRMFAKGKKRYLCVERKRVVCCRTWFILGGRIKELIGCSILQF